MLLNYSKSYFIIYLLLVCNIINSIDMPKIKTGITSYEYYKLIEPIENESIYPSTIYDKLFFSIEEKLSDYFKYKYRVDFYAYDYNKYSSNLENLKSIAFYNGLDLFFILKKNEIKITTKPMLYYKYGEIYLKLIDKVQYKLDFKNFEFKTYYSNLYTFREDELFYHNLSLAFFWNLPKKDFMKFKSEVSVYLQHYINDFENTGKKVPILKSIKFNFELAIDFNKIEFDEIFNKDDNDDDFFNDGDYDY